MNKRLYKRLLERRKRRIIIALLFINMFDVNRLYWVHPVNCLREKKGEFYQLYPDLRHFRSKFIGMYRMEVEKFDELLQKVSPFITKKWTYMRAPISAEQKLVITLR